VHFISLKFKATINWFFEPQQLPVRWWRIIRWWELRRIPFNLFIGIYGIICLAIFFWGISGCNILKPGEDAIEPLALMASPFIANICYTLGWLVELPVRFVYPSLSPNFGPRLLKLGVGFSIIIISFPAVYWGGRRIFQFLF
jgi:hypothetical protein